MYVVSSHEGEQSSINSLSSYLLIMLLFTLEKHYSNNFSCVPKEMNYFTQYNNSCNNQTLLKAF